jgi:hypothetical protein
VELQPESLTEAEIRAATGISEREFTRLRQQGFITVAAPRQGLGLGGGRGTHPLTYLPDSIRRIRRFKELHRQFKKKEECRWRLWCYDGLPVRIAPDLADTLNQFSAVTKEIKTDEDIATKLLPLLKPAYPRVPRGHPLKVIFRRRRLKEDELRSLTIMLASLVLGIRQPLFDDRKPPAFKVFKRVFGLPEEWELPPNLFDVVPYMHEQLINALRKASPDELEFAGAVCRDLSHILDNPENWRRGAIEIAGGTLPWRAIKFAGLLWPSPLTRAVTVALAILWIQSFKKASEEIAAVVMAVVTTVSAAFATAGFPRAES